MWRELLLGTTILTNYARAVYAASNPPTYQLGPAAHGDFADDRIAQSSVGGTGTVSSTGLPRVAMLQSITNAAPPAGAGCDTTPIILSTPLNTSLTWTAIAGCGHVSAQAWGPGDKPSGTTGTGGKGGGFGQENGISVTPGNPYLYYVGGGGLDDTFFCNGTSNCADITGSAVVAGGTGGRNALSAPNVGSIKANGGTGGVKDVVSAHYGGGGGGAGGPSGDGAAGAIGLYGLHGGSGGQGDNATGGAGGTGTKFTNAGAGGNGVEIGGAHGSGGGGGASYITYYSGNGGLWGGGVGGILQASSGNNAKTPGQGGIILTPAP